MSTNKIMNHIGPLARRKLTPFPPPPPPPTPTPQKKKKKKKKKKNFFLDSSKMKEFADDNFELDEDERKFSKKD